MSRYFQKNRIWLELAAVISIGVLPDIYQGITMVLNPEFSKISYPAYYMSLTLIVRSIYVTIPVMYIILRSECSFEQFGLSKINFTRDVLLGLLLFVVSYFALAYFSPAFIYAMKMIGFVGEQKALSQMFNKPETTTGVLLLITGCIFNGFAEEFVMRGYFIERLETLLGSSVLAIIISALLFASYHIYQGAIGSVNVLVFGLIYGYAYYKIRKIWPLAIAHAVNNVIAFASLPN